MDRLARLGLFLLVFGGVALSGPGRIDIVDGDTRYETARGLVEVGAPVIRDPHIWFNVFPGRDGDLYSYYRFPPTLLGVPAIWLADALGPASEDRRRFLFSLTGAVVAGLLAVAYHVGFRDRGLSTRSAAVWAALGIAATPVWFYSTSTFDEVFGACAVVWVAVAAQRARTGLPGWSLAAGLFAGLALNCKQPLALWVFVAAAGAWDPARALRDQAARFAGIAVGVVAGLAAYGAWEWWRYPPGSTAGHAELMANYVPAFFTNPLFSVTALLFSPGASVLLYFPPLVLCLDGLVARWPHERPAIASLIASIGVFFAFISLMIIFKGDPSWGPRYLTPCCAALWLYAPHAPLLKLRPRLAAAAVTAGVVVQLLALSVDMHRLYVQRELPNAWSAAAPWLLFDAHDAHLVQRPLEIVDIASASDAPTAFSPAAAPTAAFPMVQDIPGGADAVHCYAVFTTFRPFWLAQRWLPPEQRPVPLLAAVLTLGALMLAGGALLGAAVRPRDPR